MSIAWSAGLLTNRICHPHAASIDQLQHLLVIQPVGIAIGCSKHFRFCIVLKTFNAQLDSLFAPPNPPLAGLAVSANRLLDPLVSGRHRFRQGPAVSRPQCLIFKFATHRAMLTMLQKKTPVNASTRSPPISLQAAQTASTQLRRKDHASFRAIQNGAVISD